MDSFLAQLSADGTVLLYASLLGGSETSDSGNAITLDGKGGVYIAGTSLYGPGFPTTPGSYQHTSPKTVSGGLKSGTVSKVDFGSLTVCQPLIAPTTLNVSPQGGIANFTLTVAAGCPWELNTDSGITITGEKTGMGSNSPIALSGTVLPNDSTYSSRTLLAHIGTATLTVMQQQASCLVPVFNPTSLSFDSSGGIRNVTVTLPSSCTLAAATGAPWLSTRNAGSGGAVRNQDAQPLRCAEQLWNEDHVAFR